MKDKGLKSREGAVLEALAEGLIATDREVRIFLFNPAAAEIAGIDPAAAIGRPIDTVLKLFPEGSDVMETEAVRQALSGRRGSLPDKLTLLRPDGRRLPVAGTAAPFFDRRERLQGIVVAVRDMTVEREIDRQKSGLIPIVSHQLRTPLSSIRWFLDLLLDGNAGALKPKQKEFLNDIYASTVRMIRLVGELLDVSKLEDGKLPMHPVTVDVGEMLASLEKDHVALIVGKKLKYETDVERALPKLVVDENAIRQSLANLIANAINYTPEGGTVRVTAGRSGQEMLLTVSDTGIGIPKREQYRIFGRFFRGEGAVNRETAGSGLGLYIAKMMVEAAGGRIWFESAEGEGSTFYMALPTARLKG